MSQLANNAKPPAARRTLAHTEAPRTKGPSMKRICGAETRAKNSVSVKCIKVY